jgi:hypothetical protein
MKHLESTCRPERGRHCIAGRVVYVWILRSPCRAPAAVDSFVVAIIHILHGWEGVDLSLAPALHDELTNDI